MRKRILYVQYTNPAFYPPLEHSAQILAEQGWAVCLLGVHAAGDEPVFDVRPRIRVRLLGHCAPGWRQKLHYVRYCVGMFVQALRSRPDWIYASDRSASVPALLAALACGARIVYHEHDAPPTQARTRFDRLLAWSRRRIARRAAVCVIPAAGRIPYFIETSGVPRTNILCVWNCPRAAEALPEPVKAPERFVLYYHGSLNPERLPPSIIDALALLPGHVSLRIIGYETVGSRGYVEELKARARAQGLEDRVDYRGTKSRGEMLDLARACHVGLSFMPAHADDVNLTHMAGASNKPFDYLACGMALLVSDLEEWRAMFADPGYAIACDPLNAYSVAAAVQRMLDDPALWRDMAARGRARMLADWTYEAQFAPLLTLITTRASGHCAS